MWLALMRLKFSRMAEAFQRKWLSLDGLEKAYETIFDSCLCIIILLIK